MNIEHHVQVEEGVREPHGSAQIVEDVSHAETEFLNYGARWREGLFDFHFFFEIIIFLHLMC